MHLYRDTTTFQFAIRGLSLLTVVICGCCREDKQNRNESDRVHASANPSQQDPNFKVVNAWQNAGAQFIEARQNDPASLPIFRWHKFVPGKIANLPSPTGPFVLDLSFSGVTDAGLKELTSFKSMQQLILSRTEVTDAGLNQLAELKSIQTLRLVDTKVTDVGLKELSGLVSLKVLDLNGTNVTDHGLKELAGLKSLLLLNLLGMKVTDVGLKELVGLKSLKILALNGTKVTESGVAELRKLHPNPNLIISNDRAELQK